MTLIRTFRDFSSANTELNKARIKLRNDNCQLKKLRKETEGKVAEFIKSSDIFAHKDNLDSEILKVKTFYENHTFFKFFTCFLLFRFSSLHKAMRERDIFTNLTFQTPTSNHPILNSEEEASLLNHFEEEASFLNHSDEEGSDNEVPGVNHSSDIKLPEEPAALEPPEDPFITYLDSEAGRVFLNNKTIRNKLVSSFLSSDEAGKAKICDNVEEIELALAEKKIVIKSMFSLHISPLNLYDRASPAPKTPNTLEDLIELKFVTQEQIERVILS